MKVSAVCFLLMVILPTIAYGKAGTVKQQMFTCRRCSRNFTAREYNLTKVEVLRAHFKAKNPLYHLIRKIFL